MRNADATILVVLLFVALAPRCVIQARKQPNTVDDTKEVGVTVLLAGSSGASWDLDGAAFEQHRSLKKTKFKAYKSKKKYKGTFRSKAKATLWGSVIGVATVVAVVALCTCFLMVTEKMEQHPKWHLIKRRVKPGIRRTVTRTFTRKNKPIVGDDVDKDIEMKKMPDDPRKLQGEP